MLKVTNHRLRLFNNALTVVAVLIALYIIAMPLLPQIWWWASHVVKKPNPAIVQVTKQSPPPQGPIPAGKWLDIPRLNLHQAISTYPTVAGLNMGAWHIPGSGTPATGGNTVIAGHRYLIRFDPAGGGVFYFLDKMQLNDRVTVDWQNVEYTYKVDGIKIVPPTDLAVEAPTKQPQLTLYTCTPLWTADSRLVVQASLVSKRSA